MIPVSIVGGSGYTGGELLRLLSFHPQVSIRQVSSQRLAGKFVHRAHPNLRKVSQQRFSTVDAMERVETLFLCLPHGEAIRRIDEFTALADRVVDLSADFRLNDPERYARSYGSAHGRPELLERFVYGIPEVNRCRIREADRVACAGCNATATIVGLWPLFEQGVVESTVVDLKTGSSEAGNVAGPSSHHPERSGAVRSYRPTAHRHVAEMIETLGSNRIHFSATSIEMVRGILATCHVFLSQDLDDKQLWRLYREAYGAEPFVRIVKERGGIHRYPDPKLLSGTNFCDVGFERDPDSNRVVVLSAIDNLMKGAAGQAVQCFNLMHGLPEATGLEFPGLHPV